MSEPCQSDGRISTLEHQYDSIAKTLDKFEMKLDMILTQISKVASLEVSHSHHDEAISRAFKRLEKLDEVMVTYKEFMDQTKGMAKMAYILWGGLGVTVVGLIVKIMFFMGHTP